MSKNQCDGLWMFTAQRVAELLRIGLAQPTEPVAVSQLSLNARQNLMGACLAKGCFQHVLGELHTASTQRVDAQGEFEPLGEHGIHGAGGNLVELRDFHRDDLHLVGIEAGGQLGSVLGAERHADNRHLLTAGEAIGSVPVGAGASECGGHDTMRSVGVTYEASRA